MVGNAGRLLRLINAVFPSALERSFARRVAQKHFLDEPAAPGVGNLYAHKPPTGTSGGWRRDGRRRLALAAALIAPVVLAIAFRKPRRAAWSRERAAALLR
jgi:hypothetical protein